MTRTKKSQGSISNENKQIQKAIKSMKYFRPLYERHYESVFRFVYDKTVSERETVMITKKVFLEAMKNLRSYNPENGSFAQWLTQIAKTEIQQLG